VCGCCSGNTKCICAKECSDDGACGEERCANPSGDQGFCAEDGYCG
jgi:hypothetical protein